MVEAIAARTAKEGMVSDEDSDDYQEEQQRSL
jgi:hypothetical protein